MPEMGREGREAQLVSHSIPSPAGEKAYDSGIKNPGHFPVRPEEAVCDQ